MDLWKKKLIPQILQNSADNKKDLIYYLFTGIKSVQPAVLRKKSIQRISRMSEEI